MGRKQGPGIRLDPSHQCSHGRQPDQLGEPPYLRGALGESFALLVQQSRGCEKDQHPSAAPPLRGGGEQEPGLRLDPNRACSHGQPPVSVVMLPCLRGSSSFFCPLGLGLLVSGRGRSSLTSARPPVQTRAGGSPPEGAWCATFQGPAGLGSLPLGSMLDRPMGSGGTLVYKTPLSACRPVTRGVPKVLAVRPKLPGTIFPCIAAPATWL